MNQLGLNSRKSSKLYSSDPDRDRKKKPDEGRKAGGLKRTAFFHREECRTVLKSGEIPAPCWKVFRAVRDPGFLMTALIPFRAKKAARQAVLPGCD